MSISKEEDTQMIEQLKIGERYWYPDILIFNEQGQDLEITYEGPKNVPGRYYLKLGDTYTFVYTSSKQWKLLYINK